MQLTGNTILVTGGGSGIGRAMAEEFRRRGNTVIVSGRRKEALDEVAAAAPGIEAMELDIADAAGVKAFGDEIVRRFPDLNVVVHMAGIMRNEKLTRPDAMLEVAEETIATNLLGPMRLTAALLPTLLGRPSATLMTVTSGIAYVPLALNPSYSASKAGIRGWTDAIRYQLRDTNVRLIELIPPYVRTALMGERQANDPNAMPLEDYISETFAALERDPDTRQVVVERAKMQRFAEAKGEYDQVFTTINDRLAAARKQEWDALG